MCVCVCTFLMNYFIHGMNQGTYLFALNSVSNLQHQMTKSEQNTILSGTVFSRFFPGWKNQATLTKRTLKRPTNLKKYKSKIKHLT